MLLGAGVHSDTLAGVRSDTELALPPDGIGDRPQHVVLALALRHHGLNCGLHLQITTAV